MRHCLDHSCCPFFKRSTVFIVFDSRFDKLVCLQLTYVAGLGSFSCQSLIILGHRFSVSLCSSTLEPLRLVSTPAAVASIFTLSTHFQPWVTLSWPMFFIRVLVKNCSQMFIWFSGPFPLPPHSSFNNNNSPFLCIYILYFIIYIIHDMCYKL